MIEKKDHPDKEDVIVKSWHNLHNKVYESISDT